MAKYNINNYSARTGRMIKEDNTTINIADILEKMASSGGGSGGGGTSDAHTYGYDGTAWVPTLVDEQGKQAVTTIDASVAQVTIAAGSNLSSAVDLSRKILTALVIPAGYDGGHITIQGSDKLDGTYVDVYDSTGTSIMIGVYGASRIVAIVGYSMQAIASLNYVKFKTTKNVAADRTIGIITKG